MSRVHSQFVPSLARLALATLGGWAALACPAAFGQVTLGFNGLGGPHDLLTAGPYGEDGYTLTSTAAGQLAVVNGFQPNGLALRGTTATAQILRLVNSSGSPFDLLSIGIGDNSLAQSITFAGSNGSTRLVVDSDLGVGITFGPQWQGLSWVDVTVASAPSGAPGQLTADNLVVRTVPAPAGTAVIGLAGAVALRRRRAG